MAGPGSKRFVAVAVCLWFGIALFIPVQTQFGLEKRSDSFLVLFYFSSVCNGFGSSTI